MKLLYCRSLCYHCGHRVRIRRDGTYRKHWYAAFGNLHECVGSLKSPRAPLWTKGDAA